MNTDFWPNKFEHCYRKSVSRRSSDSNVQNCLTRSQCSCVSPLTFFEFVQVETAPAWKEGLQLSRRHLLRTDGKESELRVKCDL